MQTKIYWNGTELLIKNLSAFGICQEQDDTKIYWRHFNLAINGKNNMKFWVLEQLKSPVNKTQEVDSTHSKG